MIYVIGPEDGPYKIGCTDYPEVRLGDLQIGNWVELKIHAQFPGSYSLEGYLHEAFADKRIRGEWFDLEEADVFRMLALIQKWEEKPSLRKIRTKRGKKILPKNACKCGRIKSKGAIQCIDCYKKSVRRNHG